MRKLVVSGVSALLAVLMIVSAVFASVTFDPTTGVGFVGKGDVQVAFNLNNPQIQAALIANPQAFTFAYSRTDTYDAVCTWVTGEGKPGEKTHNVTHTTATDISAAINGSPRSGPSQFTGFNLSGFGATTETGTVPVVGEACMGNEGHGGLWSSVTPTGSTGGLYVTYTPVPPGAVQGPVLLQ